MRANLSLIEPVQVDGVWPRIALMMARACSRSHGRYTAADAKALAKSGAWQLWMMERGEEVVAIGGTSIAEYPTGLKAITWHYGTGSSRADMEYAMTLILEWAKDQGCERAEGIFRRGWKRVFKDWEHTHEYLERSL